MKGRPMELDALVGSVAELGRLTGIPNSHARHGPGPDPPPRSVRLIDPADRPPERQPVKTGM